MTKKLNKKFIFSLLIFIVLVLISAFLIEYKLGYKACKLCLYERIPYILSALLIIHILVFNQYVKITLLIISFIFICSSILAFYHFGIEQDFFSESLACKTNDLSETLTKDEILKQLNLSLIHI